MKRIFRSFFILIITGLIIFSSVSLAQERKIKLEEYLKQLEEWQEREASARALMAEEQKKILALKNEIETIEHEIAVVGNEIYDLLGTDEDGLNRYSEDLADLREQVEDLRALPAEELLTRQDEIAGLRKRLDELKKDKHSLLTEYSEELDLISGLLDQMKVKAPQSRNEYYLVSRGDCLWRISGKKQIYNDPYKWPRIFSANRDQIKDPDLIYPDQRLLIPRELGANEHLVVRNEWLAKIAGYAEVYGDPFKWTLIYEANRNQIWDPNIIYPEQILTIPRD